MHAREILVNVFSSQVSALLAWLYTIYSFIPDTQFSIKPYIFLLSFPVFQLVFFQGFS